MWPFLRSLFGYNTTPEAPASEKRGTDMAVNQGWTGWATWGNSAASGVSVTRETALGVPAIWDAINKVSTTLASLPFGIFEVTETGSQPAKRHPLYHTIRLEPNPWQSAYNFRQALFAQACFGDAYAKITRNGIGRPTSLEVIDAACVTLFQRDNGEYYYIVRRSIGSRYVEEAIATSDMIHIKGLTLDGMAGQSVTKVHRDSIGMSIAAEEYGSFFFANGANPSGAIVYPQGLTPQQREIAERKVNEKNGGLRKTGQVMVLDAGVKFEKMSLDPSNAMLNETRNFQVNQAARIFGVPVPLLQQLDKATLNNMETMGIQFVNLCLRPWAVQVEQEFARKLLTYDERRSEAYFFRFNFNGLLRADTKARGEYYKLALGGPSTGIGFMSVNEVRELENLDRIDDGDEVFTADILKDMQNNGQDQTATPGNGNGSDAQTNNEDDGTPQASAGDGGND